MREWATALLPALFSILTASNLEVWEIEPSEDKLLRDKLILEAIAYGELITGTNTALKKTQRCKLLKKFHFPFSLPPPPPPPKKKKKKGYSMQKWLTSNYECHCLHSPTPLYFFGGRVGKTWLPSTN